MTLFVENIFHDRIIFPAFYFRYFKSESLRRQRKGRFMSLSKKNYIINLKKSPLSAKALIFLNNTSCRGYFLSKEIANS